MQTNITSPFPFAIKTNGRIEASGGDEAIRGKIIQVLFTAPGERVHLPDFGCGLFNLVFEPNDEILAATAEFTVRGALNRWLVKEIVVENVRILAQDESLFIEVFYTKREDLTQDAVRIQFR